MKYLILVCMMFSASAFGGFYQSKEPVEGKQQIDVEIRSEFVRVGIGEINQPGSMNADRENNGYFVSPAELTSEYDCEKQVLSISVEPKKFENEFNDTLYAFRPKMAAIDIYTPSGEWRGTFSPVKMNELNFEFFVPSDIAATKSLVAVSATGAIESRGDQGKYQHQWELDTYFHFFIKNNCN